MDRDRSILIQVAAKIAAELTQTTLSAEQKVSEFATIFPDIKDILIEAVYGSAGEEQMLAQAFPTGHTVSSGGNLKVRNDQQGPLPQWLLDACAKDGVTEVYDNRGDLAGNPKRPWFKAVNDKEKAYWPPKGA